MDINCKKWICELSVKVSPSILICLLLLYQNLNLQRKPVYQVYQGGVGTSDVPKPITILGNLNIITATYAENVQNLPKRVPILYPPYVK